MEASLILDGLGKVEKSHWMFTNYHLLSSIILVFDYHDDSKRVLWASLGPVPWAHSNICQNLWDELKNMSVFRIAPKQTCCFVV